MATQNDTTSMSNDGYFAQLPFGSCGYDTAFASSPAAQNITVPGAVMLPEARPASPLHDTGSVILLLIVFLLVALNYKRGYKYFSHLGNYLFSVRRRQNTFDDHTVYESTLMLSLIINTCVMGGMIIYLVISYYYPELFEGQSVSRFMWVLSGSVLLFYAAQYILFRILGYTFLHDQASTNLLIAGFNSTYSVLGLLLCPVAFVMLLAPSMLVPMAHIAIILYITARIVFICKGFRIFFKNLASLLYFILYLCSVEIVPVILSFTGAIFLCRVLQS